MFLGEQIVEAEREAICAVLARFVADHPDASLDEIVEGLGDWAGLVRLRDVMGRSDLERHAPPRVDLIGPRARTKYEKALLSAVRRAGKDASTAELRRLVGGTYGQVIRIVKGLVADGKLVAVGDGPQRRYHLSQ